jgi:ankyrin repeat protein
MSLSHLPFELLTLILALLSKRDKAGWGSLHWTAFCGYEGVVQWLLLEKGADVEAQAALLFAAYNGHEVVVKLLLEKGAENLLD